MRQAHCLPGPTGPRPFVIQAEFVGLDSHRLRAVVGEERLRIDAMRIHETGELQSSVEVPFHQRMQIPVDPLEVDSIRVVVARRRRRCRFGKVETACEQQCEHGHHDRGRPVAQTQPRSPVWTPRFPHRSLGEERVPAGMSL